LLLYWVYRNLRIIIRRLHGEDGFLATVLPGVAGSLGAIFIGDQFAQYPKFEARFWFIALAIVMLHLTAQRASQEVAEQSAQLGGKRGAKPRLLSAKLAARKQAGL
jgi:hypothetical protein